MFESYIFERMRSVWRFRVVFCVVGGGAMREITLIIDSLPLCEIPPFLLNFFSRGNMQCTRGNRARTENNFADGR